MKDINFRRIKLGWKSVSVVIVILMITASFVTGMAIQKTDSLEIKTSFSDKSLSYSFLFKEPEIQTTEVSDSEYALIDMPGCMAIGKQAGEPMMPVKIVSLLLPPMKTVSNIQVTGTPVKIELGDFDLVEKPVFPYQNPVPFGSAPEEFIIKDTVYSTDALYPSVPQDEHHIGYSRGYAIFDVALNPLQYNPVKGELSYYPEMRVNIILEDSEPNQFFRNNPDDEAWVKKLVYNPEMTESYTSDIPTFGYDGGLCDPDDDHDYVIITTEDGDLDYWDTSETTPYNWGSLMDKHASDDGFSCALVTEQEIDDCEDYHGAEPVDDLQARIREFCKDAYQDWEADYVLIGGDDELIAAREMDTNYETNIDSDIYWSNLDNTFNDDEDGYWGEEGDDGFDLYAEIFIGRLTCDEPQDVSNWMTKSFYYADCFEPEFLEWAAFYGGDTGWNCQGDDFMDYSAVKGTDNWLGPIPGSDGPFPTWAGFQYGFETWNADPVPIPENAFDISEMWTAEPPNPGWQGGSESQAITGFREAINNNHVAIASGIAHANAGMSLDVGSSSWESNYHNTKPFFLHDYGCHCGDMDAADDGVLHSMLFHDDTELAFGVVYNTCYGWGNFDTTNSSSAFQAKEFWSYFLDLENKSGDFNNWQLGKAHAYSKDRMAPTINWDYSYGTWRAIIQGCLLFADPAQKIKTPYPSEKPEKPDSPDGPDEWIQDVECTFTAVTNDPEEEGIYYMFDWGDGNFSEWLGPYPSGQTMDTSYAWAELGEYEVRVKARDIWGVMSDWSDPALLSIVKNKLPTNPAIDGKSFGFGGIEYEYTFVSTDEDGHDIYYQIDWDDGERTEWLGPYSSGEEIALSHSWDKKGTYWIKAWTKDTLEGESSQASFKLQILTNKIQQSVHNTLLLNMLLSQKPQSS